MINKIPSFMWGVSCFRVKISKVYPFMTFCCSLTDQTKASGWKNTIKSWAKIKILTNSEFELKLPEMTNDSQSCHGFYRRARECMVLEKIGGLFRVDSIIVGVLINSFWVSFSYLKVKRAINRFVKKSFIN